MTHPALPWHVPVRLDEVPETGLHLDLVADEPVRVGLATLAAVAGIPRAEATLDVVRHGNGLRATGRVSATIEQICVVTLDSIEKEVNETIDVIFAPQSAPQDDTGFSEEAISETDDPPDLLADGTADLGALAAEFLLLGIDPYPRKPGAAFMPPVGPDAAPGPFSTLARLRDTKN
jgi:hypothetical protein